MLLRWKETLLHDILRGFSYLNMGNCCERCFGRLDKRKYLRTRYNVERDFSIEFENLMDDDGQQDEMPKAGYGAVVSAEERKLIAQRQYETLIGKQRKIDAQLDAELVRQEEELRMEEEAYYEAKREAARVAKMQRQKEMMSKQSGMVVRTGPKAWLGEDDDWDVAGGEDDFEMFLESVKARSLAARTRALPIGVPIDAQSTSDDRSRTEASSIDLEWEHEAGMQPIPKEKRKSQLAIEDAPPLPPNLSELAMKPMLLKEKQPDSFSNDFEWDNDYNDNNDQLESRTLLGKRGVEDDADR